MNETTDAIAIFAPIWRRKWLILLVGLAVGAASYAYYRRAQRVFQANTQVYLGAGAEEAAPGEKSGGKTPSTNLANQSAIISSIVVERVRRQLRAEHKDAVLRGAVVRAKGAEKSEFIVITTEAHTATGAALLANRTAQTYVRRQRAQHQRSIEKAIAITRRQLRRIEAASVPAAPAKSTTTTTQGKGAQAKAPAAAAPSTASILQAANLNTKINQLEASLAVAGAQQVKPVTAQGTVQLAPKPRQKAIFGFVIGLVLAAIAAYALSRYDRRLRSLTAIEAVYGPRTITGLPKVKRPIVMRDGQPAPSRFLLEPVRRLQTALALGPAVEAEAGQKSPRVLLFTSSDAGDGKSTLVAALALVQREGNVRVAVVEANFRRPTLAKRLGLEPSAGLAGVLGGTVALNDAMQRVHPIEPAPLAQPAAAEGGVATIAGARETGSLALLGGGGEVANPPALLANGAIGGVLRTLAEDYDYVLVDAPSPLEVSDVMPLLGLVDGIVLVARVAHTREPSAQRLVQLLAQTPSAPVLGLVANCLPRKESKRFGFSGSSRAAS